MKKKVLEIALWLVFIAASVGVAAHYWNDAFPVAAVPFPLTRAQVLGRMGTFLDGMGAPVSDYRSTILFEESSSPKNFVERQYGPARLAELARRGMEIWYWESRWFKPEQHEEYRVWTNQAGSLTGYWHIIEEERALPTLPEPQARVLAEDFLKKNVPAHPVASLKYLEAASEQKPNRTDYTFTWEDPALRLGDAPYHLNVTVQGNEIGSYGEFLKVPEWWTIKYERERALNELCYRIAGFASLAIILGLMILFLRGVHHHQVRWWNVAPWGWYVVIGGTALATQANDFPSSLFAYATTQQWLPFIAGSIFNAIRSALGSVLLFWLILLVADCLYREQLPGKSSFRRALGTMALRDPQTVRALGMGIAFGAFALAYVCVFYTVGQRLGVWCPVDIDFSKTISGPMPWIEAMNTGLSASFTEEMLFRVGALLLIWRLVRVRWLAVLLAAASWGFLHSTYPQMPGYTRGIELTIAGCLWGCLLLRYGVVATLTAHYLYDCWLGSLIAFNTASWENKAGALVVSLWPVAFFLWGCWKKGPELELEEPHVLAKLDIPRPPPREWKHHPLGLGTKGVALLLLGCAAAIAAIFLLPLPQRKIERLGRLDLSREAILAKANAALLGRGYSPAGYRRLASVEPRAVYGEYMLNYGDLDRLASLWNNDWPEVTWTVRYFKFLQPEEFSVALDEHGNFQSWSHTVLREAPGAQLDEPAALACAKETLAKDGHVDLAQQALIREQPVQQENRRDWIFEFDQKNFGWGDAKLRTRVLLQGAEAMAFGRWVKLPDAWLLEHFKSGWKQFVSGELKRWVRMGEIGLVAVLLVLAIQKHVTPWRKAFLYALYPFALRFADELNQLPQFYAAYTTTIPQGQYLFTQGGSMVVSLVLAYLQGVFLIAVALGFLHWAWGWIPEQWEPWPAGRRERGRFWQDTLLIVLGSLVLLWVLEFVDAEVRGHFWPAEVIAIRYWSVDEWTPWIGAVTESLRYAYSQMIRLAITASVLCLVWRRHPRVAWALLLLMPLLDLATPETLGGFIWGLVYAEVLLLVTAWLVLKVWRFNVAAVFLVYWLGDVLGLISLFLRKGGPVYGWDAAPLIGMILAVLGLIWWNAARAPGVEPAAA